MLQFIRERAQGWIAGVIVFLICIPFALWGINSYMDGGGAVDVAEVNGDPVTLQEYQDALQRYRRQLQAMFGEQMDVNNINPDILKAEALNQLINEKLLRQYADRNGLRISDQQLAAAIRSFPAFLDGEQFSSSLYEQRLRTTGMNARSFEQQLRRDMLIEQMRQGIADTALVTDAEAQALFVLRGQKRDIRWTIIPAAAFRDDITITDEQVRAHYDAHLDDYRTPETVSVAYVELSVDALAADIDASDAELRAWFDANQDQFFAREERSANHVLIQLARDASDAEVEIAREKALEVKRRVLAGEDFEELAREVSDDVGSRADGGDTGLFSRGVMAPEFEDAVFSMSPGDISDPIRTDFGMHIIRLNEIKAGGVKPFEEIRAEVADAWKRQQAESLFVDQAERLAALAFEQPDSLAPASEELGLSVLESDLFSRGGGDGIAAEPKVVTAAFSDEVLLEGANSAIIELDPDRIIVLRRLEHNEARVREFSDVAGQIREQLLAEALRERTREHGEALLAELRAGLEPAALGERESLEWTFVEGADRDDPKVNRAVSRKAFALGRPAEESPVYGGVAMGTGDYALVEVSAVSDGEPVELDSRVAREALQGVEQVRTLSEWQLFLSMLSDDAKIRRYEDRL